MKPAAILSVGVLLAGLLGWILSAEEQAVLHSSQTVQLPIAMYHSVTDEGESPGAYVISPKRLEEDLQYLNENGFETVTVSDVIAFVEDGTPLPEKPVMLTFDDGYYNNYANAYPLLLRYRMCAVLSPVGTLTEQFTALDEPENEIWSYCTGWELQEMADSGLVELQNHSYDFHTLSPRKGCLRNSGEALETYQTVFADDTQKAQAVFARLGIAEPVCYTYPYGACSEESEQLVKRCGFSASLGCEEGINRLIEGDPSQLFRMKRYNRDGRQTTADFWNGVQEAMQ
ncbi:MAG: polysaccharide deacetylase family protein [Eubacteriales bacterium]|nr:polysaccharide deacetylase family protein [Eubacteriales bacterium]